MPRRRREDPLYLRGGVYWCRVRDRSGRIVRKSTRCRDREAALVRWRELERRNVDPGHATSAKATFGECVKDMIAELRRRGRAKATIEIAEQKLGHFVRLWGTRLPMADVNAQLVADYLDKRKLEGGASDFTHKKEIGELRKLLKVARHLGKFPYEIDRVLPLYVAGKHTPRTRAPSFEEARALFENLETDRAAHLAFMAATGARRGESDRAQPEDIGERTVYLRGTKTGGSKRYVPITPITRPYLDWAIANAPGKQKGAPMFRPWGKLHRDVAAACVRAGIAKVTPNDLRRAMATWHRQAGVALDEIQPMLGHASTKMAREVYAKLEGERLAELLDAKLANPTVPDLYRNAPQTPETASNTDLGNSANAGNSADSAAPPARIELATNGLGSRFLPLPRGKRSPRKTGNKLAWARRSIGETVPDLYHDTAGSESDGDEPPSGPGVARCPACSPGRTFRIEGARVVQIGGRQ